MTDVASLRFVSASAGLECRPFYRSVPSAEEVSFLNYPGLSMNLAHNGPHLITIGRAKSYLVISPVKYFFSFGFHCR